MKKILLYALIQLSFFHFPAGMASADPVTQTYTVAVVPQFASTQVFRDWQPFLAELEKATGYHFKLKVYDSFPPFEDDFAKGIPDFIYLNPYHMVIAHKKQKYRPIVRDTAPLSGILVVKDDSPAHSIKDLRNKTIAFPSHNAFGASLYMRSLLSEKYKITYTPVYVNGHQNVYRQLLRGDVAAGGGVQRTLDKEPDAVKSKLRVIFSIPEVAPHPLAVHPRVPASVSKKIGNAILHMDKSENTEKLLDAILMPNPTLADYQKDYAGLVRLKLEKYAKSE